ncbi:MAG: potassium-transporting ATPase subunit C [Verrucomicrobia bacterium]|nr:potassium-transporting ATPase subunit C [Verrucomicrobiota bacterium]
MKSLIASIRLVAATMLVCVAGYTALILAVGQIVTPDTANGSLLMDQDGKIIGSRLIAQRFEQPRYFWPRPSAVDYDGAGAGGSNKSPTSSALTERARQVVVQHGASADRPLPAELAAASGGGLDPHISEHAARYQAERVAKARGVPQSQVEALIKRQAFAPGGFFTPDRLVNVLELNLALDSPDPKQ